MYEGGIGVWMIYGVSLQSPATDNRLLDTLDIVQTTRSVTAVDTVCDHALST